jgi:hypothetical protein
MTVRADLGRLAVLWIANQMPHVVTQRLNTCAPHKVPHSTDWLSLEYAVARQLPTVATASGGRHTFTMTQTISAAVPELHTWAHHDTRSPTSRIKQHFAAWPDPGQAIEQGPGCCRTAVIIGIP